MVVMRIIDCRRIRRVANKNIAGNKEKQDVGEWINGTTLNERELKKKKLLNTYIGNL